MSPASHGRRLGAFLLDSFFLALCGGLLGAIVFISNLAKASAASMFVGSAALILYVVLPYLYYVIMHAGPRHATFGKRVAGLVILTTAGEPLTKLRAFARVLMQWSLPIAGVFIFVTPMATFASMKPNAADSTALAVGIVGAAVVLGPYVTMFFNHQRQSLYDMICGTCVVRA